MEIKYPKNPILECNHCGNLTPHTLHSTYQHSMYFDETEDEKLYEPYTWLTYTCGTCGGLTIYGGFFEFYTDYKSLSQHRLYPRGDELLPPAHTLLPFNPVPEKILKIYQEVWPLRKRAPVAFVGQVRRLLEHVCIDQKAKGKDLFEKLKNLSSKGVFPGYFTQITDLLRKVGNMGSHAMEEDLSIWDAELIDDFFRSIIEYVYIAPSRIRRMESRLKSHEKRNKKP